jgi:ABC-type spermidine/putrescine transport system permease subunit I
MGDYVSVFARSFVLAVISTAVCMIIGYPVAFLLAKERPRVQRVLLMLVMLPMWINFLLRTYAWMSILENTGLLNHLLTALGLPTLSVINTPAAVVIGMVYNFLPFMILPVYSVIVKIDRSLIEAAQDLGADSTTVFRTIVLPLIRPAFISGMSYTFVRSMTAVSAIIFLISAQWYHMTVLIYNFSESIRFGLASVLSTVLIIIVFATFGLMRLLVRKNEYLEKSVNLN